MTHILSKRFIARFIAIPAFFIVTTPTFAQTRVESAEVARQINAANTLLRDGDIDGAIDAYRHIVPGDQQRDELNYNLAVAEYRKGNIETAEQLFIEVASSATATVSAGSRYNLGNCQYAKALQLADRDRPAAIENLRHAISHYRDSLRANPNNADARANIELAGELIRRLEQERQQQEEQEKQQQDKQDEDQPDQQQKNDSEQQPSDQNQQGDEQQNQNGKSKQDKSQNDGEQKQNSDEQKSGSEKTDDQQSQDEQPGSDDAQPQESKSADSGTEAKNQSPPRKNQQSSGKQQQADQQTAGEEQESKDQPVPTGDLTAAAAPNNDKKPTNAVGAADPNRKDGLMTLEEALKMLQAVRDRDMLRRIRQQHQERSRRVPVDRDW